MENEKDHPWLAFYYKEGDTLVGQPVQVGVPIMIHEADGKESGLLLITKISLKHIDTMCMCQRPGCTRRIRLRVERSGHHPPSLVAE